MFIETFQKWFTNMMTHGYCIVASYFTNLFFFSSLFDKWQVGLVIISNTCKFNYWEKASSGSMIDIVIGWMCGNQRRQRSFCCGACFSSGSARSELCQWCKQGACDHCYQAGKWKHYSQWTAVGSAVRYHVIVIDKNICFIDWFIYLLIGRCSIDGLIDIINQIIMLVIGLF